MDLPCDIRTSACYIEVLGAANLCHCKGGNVANLMYKNNSAGVYRSMGALLSVFFHS